MSVAICCLLLLGVALAVNASVAINDAHVDKHWEDFKYKHNKVYDTKSDELYRRSVFEQALVRVFEQQLAFDRGEETYTKGINQFSDMTMDELALGDRRITCRVHRRYGRKDNATQHVEVLTGELGDPPASKDWVTDGKVSPVLRDQRIGACGGCYAFGAVSAIESAHAIKHGVSGAHVLQLSEQQAIDCGWEFDCSGCAGGHPAGIYEMVIAKKGMMVAADYPWRKDQSKKQACQKWKKGTKVDLTAFKEFDRVKKADELLVNNVGLVGPTTASVCVSQSFVDYKKGVFKDADCFKNCLANDDGINHTIVVVGYTKDYFIIRNSWGAWGEGGYMKLMRVSQGMPLCNIGSDQTYPVVK